ncbi:zinc-ribbon domain-containing protein [Porcipelethomonas sp.]|uniref:zinc-ribbon domain-containing protein n=1 Tax=Porcipelethomonas sp. TaxID=2981675 RepID=UPI003EF2784C
MFCKNCGNELKKGAAFCHECGAKVELNETVQSNPIEANVSQLSMANSGGTTSVKKMSKGKIILVAVFAILIIIVLACAIGGGDSSPFGEYSEEDVVKTLAISTVREQYSVSHDQDVYDVEILDTDGKCNYIVSATTEDKHGFETWWILLLKFDTDSGKYLKYIHYHGEDDWYGEIDGGRFTKDNIPEYYRTNDEFGWGEENHIE